MANLKFSPQAWEEYIYWQSSNKKIVKRINELIKVCIRTPFEGIGKPEPLKGNLSSWWSRRITEVDRMVYKMDGDTLIIAQLRYHY
ncbi:MAG: Txe/YoeB family addiction module toxin [Victivallales bacterium]|jgi:toxin YoeB|nr:Txe/YoeB family addiction module toxin [Victivallales bacterium]